MLATYDSYFIALCSLLYIVCKTKFIQLILIDNLCYFSDVLQFWQDTKINR